MSLSSSRYIIDQIIALAYDPSEVIEFLSTKKGFERFSSDYSSEIFMTLPAFHIVAAKEFETAQEAEEWLGYAVHQMGHESINKPDRSMPDTERTALQVACLSGNIIGVNWLVAHGAIANSKPSPYLCACASSVDRLAKILLLEEHGYRFSAEAIFYAAGAVFSSAADAHEVLHHLVAKRGASVNALCANVLLGEGFSFALRMQAGGSIHGVVWLVEHKAAVDSVTKGGVTPLMYACESEIDSFLKVRYLCERGADCLAKDKEDISTLFYALSGVLSSANESDDPKEFLQYLFEKGLSVNSTSKSGKTPLLHVASTTASVEFSPRMASVGSPIPEVHSKYIREDSQVIIQHLIERGADVTATDSMNRNALHPAVRNGVFNSEAIQILIDSGVDVTSKDKEGDAPHHRALDLRVRKLLKQHYDTARFSVLREKVPPDSIKVCVIGGEMAGKTTFVNAFYEVDCPPIDPNDRTAGVDVRTGYIPGVGRGSTWDFGAQWTFHAAHGLFFASTNTIFILVLRLREDGKTTSEGLLLEKGRYWCAFAKAPLRTLLSDRDSRIPVLIIGNVVRSGEEAGVEASFQLKRVARTLEEEFGDTFKFAYALEIDCSRSASQRMNDCRDKLRKLREDLLASAAQVPKLCYEIEEKLSDPDEKRQRKLGCFMTAQQFDKWVDTDVEVNLAEDERKISVEYLDSSGIIVNLGRRICLRPVWLCRNVIGPLMAPLLFPFAMKTGKGGQASTDDIKSALKAFEDDLNHKGAPSLYSVTAEEAIEVLLYLELCIPVENMPGVYQIPALLHDSMPSEAWAESSSLDVYRGQRYECVSAVDIISPSSFVVLQSRCLRMANTSHQAWKDGVKLVRVDECKVVECLVELGVKKGHCCIDVILRWSRNTPCEKLAKELLDVLKEMIVVACEERSSGVLLNWFYLHSTHLQRHDEDPAIYSSVEVDQKVQVRALDDVLFLIRPERSNYSTVRNLAILRREKPLESLPQRPAAGCPAQDEVEHSEASTEGCFPADEAVVSVDVMRACANVKGSKWEEIGAYLIELEELEEIRELTRSNVLRMMKVLESWKLKTERPTVGKVLNWFEQVGVNRQVIVMKYLELYR